MIKDLRNYMQQYVALGKPIYYKNLYIHSFTVEDYFLFNDVVESILIEKDKIPDIEVIKMSYLKFLATRAFVSQNIIKGNITEGDMWKYRFFTLLSKAFMVEPKEISLVEDGGLPVIYIGKEKITSEDFDEIRKIICIQNIYGYDDIEMSEDVKQAVSEYYSIKNKSMVKLTLDDKISIIMAKSNRSQRDINELSLVRFETIFSKMVEEDEYIVAKIAESNGCKFDKPVEHWVYKKKTEKYAEAFSSLDEFKSKII